MPANNRSAVSGGLNLSLESLGVNLPYSMEAEQAVLGAAILDADIIPKMVEPLRPEMFYARQKDVYKRQAVARSKSLDAPVEISSRTSFSATRPPSSVTILSSICFLVT